MIANPRTEHDGWVPDAPPLVRRLAVAGIESVAAVEEFMERCRTRGGGFASPPRVDHTEWLRYYTSSFRVTRGAVRALVSAAGGLTTLRGESELLDCRSSEPWPGRVFDDPAMQFLLRVAVPCWFVHRTSAHRLVDAVDSGGSTAAEAVERLIRLDPWFAEHEVARRWIRAHPQLKAERAHDVQRWMHSTTAFDKPKSPNAWLQRVLGCLSWISEVCGRRLTEPELRELVELASDRLPEHAVEYVRHTSNENVAKAIYRQRKWCH